ncbi:hypothetical protein R5R35_006027 [Gryllus longicercus]|uniref:SMP-30/Gluconolactonase/LRE-like region domain-containing protein n=1 Tax=Gryllus longicercus TaxID=2509291 RepID=A0AAN9VZ70_9ORTH
MAQSEKNGEPPGSKGNAAKQAASGRGSISTPRGSNSPKVTSASTPALLGESPFWVERMHALLYVDILGSEVRRLRHTDKHGESIVKFDEAITFVVPVEGKEDKFAIGQGNDIVLVTWDGHSQKPPREVLITVGQGRKNKVTVGKVDPSGRLWIGTSDHLDPEARTSSTRGGLFSLDRGRQLKKHVGDISGCYGLEWSLDGKTMFFVEPLKKTVDAFNFDAEKGELSNRRVLLDYTNKMRGEPRGLTIDEEGKLWVASFGGSQVLRVDPESGEVMKRLPVPCRDVTNVAFGGDDMEDLFVTTCSSRLEPSERNAYPGSGTTFRVTDLGVKGTRARHFVL